MTRVQLILAVAALMCVTSTPVTAQESVAQTTIASRLVGGVRSILVLVQEPDGRLVDEVRIEFPNNVSQTAVPMVVPGGWAFDRDGRWVRLFGEAVRPPFRIRISLFDTRALERLRTRLRFEGNNLWDDRVAVSELPPLEPAARTAGFLQIPSDVRSGDTLEMEISNPEATPNDGQWFIAGVPAQAGEGNRVRVELPLDLQTGSPVRVAFFDVWGERVLDALSADDVVVTEPTGGPPAGARISGCAEYGIIGQTVCVCGDFPEDSWNGIRIDGQPAVVRAASRHVLHLGLTDSIDPGLHTISGDPDFGFSGADAVPTLALRLQGSVDVDALFRGQSTTMRLTLEGTAEAMPLAVTNRTPHVVSIPGGNYQEIMTSGGSDNSLQRPVNARSVGNFLIDTEIPGPSCPCMEQTADYTSPASRDDLLLVPRRVLATIAIATPQQILTTAQAIALANGLAVVEVVPLVMTNEALAVFEILDGIGAIAKAAALAADPNVTLAQPDFVYDVSQQGAPGSQVVYGSQLIGADLARQVSNGDGVRVAVIDTGVDSGHPNLEGRIAEYFDVTGDGWTPDAHGTLVAGVIAANAVEDGGFEGIAPGAELVAVKSCVAHSPTRATARCWSSTLARGIDVASQQSVRVMNLSVGGPEDRLLARMVTAARSAGIAVVSAAGNDGPSGRPSYPAAFDDVMAVTAVDAASRVYGQATRGSFVDLAAPGVDILSTGPGGRTQLFSGTSAATAFTTGAVALLLGQSDLTPDELGVLLRETARDLGDAGPDADFGSGLIDICRAMARSSRDALACR